MFRFGFFIFQLAFELLDPEIRLRLSVTPREERANASDEQDVIGLVWWSDWGDVAVLCNARCCFGPQLVVFIRISTTRSTLGPP